MRYPDFLRPNGTVGFVAPSFGAAEDPYKSAFLHAVKRLQSLGYRTAAGPNCFAAEGVGISSAPERCGAELNEMYLGNGADVLLSVGGGELMCEVVPYIDFAAIAVAKPKWYMGFSDNTNFTFLSATIADTAAIYGPNAPSFGMEPLHHSLNDALDVLTGATAAVKSYDQWELVSEKDAEHPLAPYHLTEQTAYRYFNCGGEAVVKLEGRLLGGCVDCLATLLGTRFDRVRAFNERYRTDGVLWFLECCDLNPFGMRRAYWQMREAGWFDTAAGFLIGRPAHYSEELMGCERFTALEPLLSLGKPVIADVDLGHLPPMLPFVTGALAEAVAEGDELELRYRFA